MVAQAFDFGDYEWKGTKAFRYGKSFAYFPYFPSFPKNQNGNYQSQKHQRQIIHKVKIIHLKNLSCSKESYQRNGITQSENILKQVEHPQQYGLFLENINIETKQQVKLKIMLYSMDKEGTLNKEKNKVNGRKKFIIFLCELINIKQLGKAKRLKLESMEMTKGTESGNIIQTITRLVEVIIIIREQKLVNGQNQVHCFFQILFLFLMAITKKAKKLDYGNLALKIRK
ncbi:unnamed protein product [Paramecium octaurelia]|uniref:Uncharacterized protein n=1 Tax=Paramecium octaurelia TaxID=43137 RepID=A0A8S1SCK9_PAROT|nr:unnamed protein product [Paramecium octaurelia]